ncbi:uncharacterized protein [Mobula birostris]|uniref:uncharacterized protein isoform X2 n=1 Tax=Mobula birostris TaxID=1983395 RepID=UPI003B288BBD
MASLPKWKAQLLERKRRDEEEGRRKEEEELARLASIPAWKKEVMERRRRSRLGPRPHPAPQPPDQAEESLPAGSGDPGTQEASVLCEAIAPVNRNPFVRQERRRWDEGAGAGRGPGVRPRQLSPPPPLPSAQAGWAAAVEQPGRRVGTHRRPLAPEPLTRSVEDLSCLGREQEEAEGEEEEEEREQEPRRGRVSRLLSRFGQRRGVTTRSRSTEPLPRLPSLPLTRGPSRGGPPPEARKPEPPPPTSSLPLTDGNHVEEGAGSVGERPAERPWEDEQGAGLPGEVSEAQEAEPPPLALPLPTAHPPEPEACGSPGAGSHLELQPISSSSPSCAGPASDCLPAAAAATAASCPAAAEWAGGGGGEAEAEGDGPWAQEAEVSPDRPESPEQPAPHQDLAMSGLRGSEGEKQEARLIARPGLATQSPGRSPRTEPGEGQGPRGLWGGCRPGLTPQRKAGRTITINPRKMAASKAAAATAENGTEAPPATAPSPAAPAKKRYPTAEEILVIGGYLSLRRSCLVKAGATRRKLNISFNESESIFEYPSELALLAEFGTGEDEVLPQVREPQEEEEEEEEEALVSRREAPGSPVVRRAVRRKPLLVDESCR